MAPSSQELEPPANPAQFRLTTQEASTKPLRHVRIGLGLMPSDPNFIALGANDMSMAGSVPVATFTANMQALITRAKAGGDVVLVWKRSGKHPAWGTVEMQEAYRRAIIALGILNKCKVVDCDARFGTFTEANALGLFFDGILESSAMYANQAALLAGATIFQI